MLDASSTPSRWRHLSLQSAVVLLFVLGARGDISNSHEEGVPRVARETNYPAERPDYPGEAEEFRKLQLQDQNGSIPPDGLLRARAHVQEMRRTALSTPPGTAGVTPASWTWLGPGNIGGRVRSLLIHPTIPSIMFAGSVSGGIWKTTDSGASWAPIDDFMANLMVTTLAMQPGNPNIIYAGTGEGVYFLPAGTRGAGIFKSMDGGTTWTQLAATANPSFYYVNRLAVAPDGTLLAATQTGLWRSTTGGAGFVSAIGLSNVADVTFNPSNPLLAVASSQNGQAWYSTSGGATWTPAAGLPGTGRVEIAYAPSQPTIVYASVDTAGGSIYKSTNGGASYGLVFNGSPDYVGSQGWWDNALWVDPTNSDFLIVGGIDLWKSTNGGVSLTQISTWWAAPGSAHADHHVIVEPPGFDGVSNRTVFFGNDGGVYKTDNVYTVGGPSSPYTAGWTELVNTLGITQFYGGAVNPVTGTIIGGTQDNGTIRYTVAGGTEGWTTMFGGDGGWCASDPTDPNYFYGEYVYLQIHRSTNGGATANYIYGGITDAGAGATANFIAPFILDPNNASRMLAGGASLWLSANVKAPVPSWTPIKPSVGSVISAISVQAGNSDAIWAGHNNGDLYRTVNGTTASPTWTRVDLNSPPLPNRYLTRVTIDPNDGNTVYATFGGFTPDNVWKTINGGLNWTDATGTGVTGLPDVPVRDLKVHPGNSNWLYAATEIGIFTSEDGGSSWAVPQSGPANVSVDELLWMNDSLVAATHGRGFYSAALSNNQFFTDDPLIPGVTFIKAAHINQMRTRVDALRAALNLQAFAYTDSVLTLGVTAIKAVHILDLRTALSQAYEAAAATAPTYTDPTLTAAMQVKAVHVMELRAAIVSLESMVPP